MKRLTLLIAAAFAGCNSNTTGDNLPSSSDAVGQSGAPADMPEQTAGGVLVIDLYGPGNYTELGDGFPGRMYSASQYSISNVIEVHYSGTLQGRPITLYPDPGDSITKVILYHHEDGNWIEYFAERERKLIEAYQEN